MIALKHLHSVSLANSCRFLFAAIPLAISLPLDAAVLTPIGIAPPARTDRVSFHREIEPLLQANCIPCHNQTRAKGDLVLETPATMLKGGSSGPALVPGEPAESRMLQSAAHELEDYIMPPAGNKVNARDLTPAELGLLSLWIEQGAISDAPAAAVLNWQPFPSNLVSSFAVALTGDGQSVAVARGNRVFLYDVQSGQPSGRLEDPTLHGAAQRDWVTALAFSPNGETLASAGFREVRLWQRRPVQLQPFLNLDGASNWVAAAFSSDRTHVACVTENGIVEIRATRDGSMVSSRSVQASPPARLAWSTAGNFLAVADAEGVLQVIPTARQESPVAVANPGEVTAIAWFDRDRQLATTAPGKNTIQTWRLPQTSDTATNLLAGEDRLGHSSPVVALSSEPAGLSFLSAGSDGTIRRWSPDSAALPQELRVEESIISLHTIGSSQVAVGLLTGGSKLVSFGDTTNVAARFGGDPRLSANRASVEDELALCRAEVARAGALIAEAEAATKSSDEAIKKAREKREAHAKALADKEKEVNQQRETQTAAAKERDELAAELQRVAEAATKADKALEEAIAAAKLSAEQDSAAQVAASRAERLKAELDRLLAGLPPADSAVPENATAKTQEAAAAASTEAAILTAQSAAARAKAEEARSQLATNAFEAGKRKAEADRANADLPPRRKQAEDRFAAAQKAVNDLQPQVDKARITLEGSTQDVALAEKSISRATESLTQAKTAEETARKRITAAEAQLAEIHAAITWADALPVRTCAATPTGTALLTVNAEGLATRWNLTSNVPTASFVFDQGPPLAIAGVSEHQFIAVVSNALLRVDTTPAWTLQGAIGSTESTGGSQIFVDRVNALAFSPDGALLATGGGEPSRAGELKLWRVRNGELVRDLGSIHSDCVMSVAFSPRGDWLASGGADRFARLTSLSDSGERINLEGHTQHVLALAWLADASTLATAGAEGVVKLWNPKTGERRKTVEGFGKEVTGVKSVGATNQFVAVSGSGQGRVFRADGEKLRDLPAAPAFLQALAVTRNGTLIATSGDDGVLRVLELESGKLRLSLPPE